MLWQSTMKQNDGSPAMHVHVHLCTPRAFCPAAVMLFVMSCCCWTNKFFRQIGWCHALLAVLAGFFLRFLRCFCRRNCCPCASLRWISVLPSGVALLTCWFADPTISLCFLLRCALGVWARRSPDGPTYGNYNTWPAPYLMCESTAQIYWTKAFHACRVWKPKSPSNMRVLPLGNLRHFSSRNPYLCPFSCLMFLSSWSGLWIFALHILQKFSTPLGWIDPGDALNAELQVQQLRENHLSKDNLCSGQRITSTHMLCTQQIGAQILNPPDVSFSPWLSLGERSSQDGAEHE